MRSYMIQPGDNLWTIAQQTQSSVENIVAANPGVTPYPYMENIPIYHNKKRELLSAPIK